MSNESIPFADKVGISKSDDGILQLDNNETIHNHVHTIAASAQFSLAEIASGEYLKLIFPDLVGKVIPLLRESQIKFKKPATDTIKAYPTVAEESLSKFNLQFEKKGRSSISVNVDVKDTSGTVTCMGIFKWYVQKL